jgi:hypothetical protein
MAHKKGGKRITGHTMRVKNIGKPGPMKHGSKKKVTKAFTRKNT